MSQEFINSVSEEVAKKVIERLKRSQRVITSTNGHNHRYMLEIDFTIVDDTTNFMEVFYRGESIYILSGDHRQEVLDAIYTHQESIRGQFFKEFMGLK